MILQVTSASDEADDIISVVFARSDGGDLPPWEPGAHLDLVLPSGLIRQYSLCGDPADRKTYKIAILRQALGRGGSVEAHSVLEPGTQIEVRGPRNNFPLRPGVKSTFVAGGVGITPILTQVRAAAAQGRDWLLFYGGRVRSSMAFARDLRGLDPARVKLLPEDEVGLIDLSAVMSAAEGGDLYCCGPVPLLAALEGLCEARRQTLFLERFQATETHVPPTDAGEFEVLLAKNGQTLTVGGDQTVLDAILESGVELLWSCREGVCGTCIVRVLEGEPDHRDEYLTADDQAANNMMMACVSRCKGDRLVLDL